ncbi:predicted protein [Naegleria gruberi]|uniref:Predicted protein n=1 Tax=Naegleria gruberi TaxID=5762 RepID=D2W1X4_NAEGR|nr:uncharacterized protein NAEGRDRAFT_75303 [Naegleria gruberi]EFC36991.1 predicted protein [Naegleria gruberi]|eukprot:XP_002669735.1 predicted protein [Naegleria gruberi strain NEG-M]
MKTIVFVLFIVCLAACMRVVHSDTTLQFARKRMFSHESTTSNSDDSFNILIGKSKNIPFTPPTMHPYETIQQLHRVREEDPYSFSTEHYSHSEVVSRKLIQQHETNSNIRNVRKLFVEGVDYVSLNEHANFIQDGSLHSYSFEANMLTGVAFLDQEESVWDVKCGKEDGSIQVDFANGHFTARKWIPGTRMVIGKKWNCFGSSTIDQYGKEDQLAFLVLSRSILLEQGEMVKISFNVRMLKTNELFLNGQLSYKSTPVARETDKNFTSLYSTDAKKNSRSSWTQRLYAVGFNYDVNTGSVKQESLPLYSTSTSYGDFKVVCEKCYVYMNAEFRVEFEWSWLSITKAQALIGGKIEGDATLKASLSKSLSYSKGDILATLSTINFKFNIYGIPVWVDIVPKLAYSFDIQASGLLEYSRNFKASYEQYFGYQYASGTGYGPVRTGAGFEWSSSSPGLRLEASSTTTFSLYPVFDITIWSLVTTTVAIKPKLIAELSAQALAASLSEYQLFGKVESSYQVDVTINNEILKVDKELTFIQKTAIPLLSGSYSLQSSSYKAVDSNSVYSPGNAIPSLKGISDMVSFYFEIKIAPSDNYYFIEYSTGTSPPSGYKYSTDSINCKFGCTFTFTPNYYISVKIIEDHWWSNIDILVKIFNLSNVYGSAPTVTTKIFESGIVSAYIHITDRVVRFRDVPTGSYQIGTTTTFDFDHQKTFLDNNFVAFRSDRSITGLPFQFIPLIENGYYYYYSQNAPRNFTIYGYSGANINFVNAIAYRMVYPKTTVRLSEIIRDTMSLNTFVQAVETVSNRYVVTLQAKGSFDILVYEGWISNYNIYQTKGKKYQYIETQTGNVEILPSRIHHFTFSLENNYGNSIPKIQIVVAQLVPINQVIIESIRFDPYMASQLTSSSLSTNVLIEQQVAKNSIFPYVKLSSTKSAKVSFSNSIDESLNMNSGLYSIGSSPISIPIPSTFDTFYLSPNRTSSESVNVNLIHNHKLLNGIPSLVKKLASSEVGAFAIPCSSSIDWNNLFLRVIDSTNGKVVQLDWVKAHVMSNNAEVLATLETVILSDGAILISPIATINSLCKVDTSNRYIQLTIESTLAITRQLEIAQSLDYSKINTRAIGQLTIDPEVSGNMYIDIAYEKYYKYELNNVKGLIFQVTTQDDCNIDLYVNKKGQVASPSFSDSNSIYASSSSLSLKGEKMSISLLSQHGSIIMLYSDRKCRFTMSTLELKATQLSLSFITNGQPSTFTSSFSTSETTLIHVKILDDNHAWDKNFISNITTQSSAANFNLFRMSSSSLTTFFSSVNFVLVNQQTLAFEFVPKVNAPVANLKNETITFKAESSMFDTKYDIQPYNQLTVGNATQPIQPSASFGNSTQPKTNDVNSIGYVNYLFMFYCIFAVISSL